MLFLREKFVICVKLLYICRVIELCGLFCGAVYRALCIENKRFVL
jgi:hypothetical protein